MALIEVGQPTEEDTLRIHNSNLSTGYSPYDSLVVIACLVNSAEKETIIKFIVLHSLIVHSFVYVVHTQSYDETQRTSVHTIIEVNTYNIYKISVCT